jgi:hypothetical protein
MKLFYKASILIQLFLAFVGKDKNKTGYMLYLLTSGSREHDNSWKSDDRKNRNYLEENDSSLEAYNDKYSLFLER